MHAVLTVHVTSFKPICTTSVVVIIKVLVPGLVSNHVVINVLNLEKLVFKNKFLYSFDIKFSCSITTEFLSDIGES